MSRRVLIRVLLSLALLMSQQLALTHVFSHWGARPTAAAASVRGKLPASPGADRSCEQCLAFAQITGAPGRELRFFLPPRQLAAALAVPAAPALAGRPCLPFHSRAPPALV